jgi:hypothetical protein
MQPHHTANFPYTSPTLFSKDSCCFQCSVRTIKFNVAAMIEHLPTEAWEEAVKPRMILPLLRRLSMIDPVRRMPLLWLETLPPVCPRDVSLVTVRYWELCRMMHAGPSDSDVFFMTFHSLASNIMHILVVREGQPIFPEDHTGIWHQISVVCGADSILTEIRDIISRARRGNRLQIEGVVQFVQRCGAVDYALFMAESMGRALTEGDFRQQALVKMCNGLKKGRRREAAKIKTLRMALHPRSTSAGIKRLGPDLLLMCVRAVKEVERIVLWEEVLEKWLDKIPALAPSVGGFV